MPVNIGIVGLGAIGSYLIDKILESENLALKAVWDISPERYDDISKRLKSPPPLLKVEEFPPDTDVFVECASTKAVESVVLESFKRGKTIIVASIAGLMDNPKLWNEINRLNGKLILPSGAIGGLDILKALEKDDIESVEITTRKHPRSIPSVAFPEGTKELEIYEGPARDAINKYPQNVNVAALLSLAGIGFDRTRVRLILDSQIKHNIHRIEIIGKTGRYQIICENFPFERNPATSQLAAQSIWACLKSLNEKIIYGI